MKINKIKNNFEKFLNEKKEEYAEASSKREMPFLVAPKILEG